MGKKSKDITGQRFGRLVAIEVAEERIISGKKRKFWRCKCDCGNETIVMQGNLTKKSGIKSCGCLQIEKASARAKDLTGQRFGKLVVIGQADPIYTKAGKPIRRWNCRCDCGNELIVLQNALTATKNGTRSCGCSRKEYQREKMEDLTGKRFGRLLVLGPEELPEKKSNGLKIGWRCRCDCGKEILTTRKELVNIGVKSCGCLLSDTAKEKIEEKNVVGHYKGTTISAIQPGRKANRNSKSGIKGVYWSVSEKKWIAKIGVQGKNITLGRFGTLEEAKEARKKGELKYFDPLIKDYNKDKEPGN